MGTPWLMTDVWGRRKGYNPINLGEKAFKYIILLFGQQMKPPRSLSRPRNSHINRRKIEK